MGLNFSLVERVNGPVWAGDEWDRPDAPAWDETPVRDMLDEPPGDETLLQMAQDDLRRARWAIRDWAVRNAWFWVLGPLNVLRLRYDTMRNPSIVEGVTLIQYLRRKRPGEPLLNSHWQIWNDLGIHCDRCGREDLTLEGVNEQGVEVVEAWQSSHGPGCDCWSGYDFGGVAICDRCGHRQEFADSTC